MKIARSIATKQFNVLKKIISLPRVTKHLHQLIE